MTGKDDEERQRIRKELRQMRPSVIDRYFEGDMYDIFTANIKEWGLTDTIIPVVGFSSAIRKTWKIPLRFIFIDGNHNYEYVKEDCLWKQFLVVGGIICFHDFRPRGPVRPPVEEEMYTDPNFEVVGLVRSVKAFRRIR